MLAFAFAGPLSCPHDIGWLGVTSGFSVFFLIYTTFIVFLYSLPTEQTGLHPCNHQAMDDDTHICEGSKTSLLYIVNYYMTALCERFKNETLHEQ